MKKLLLAFLLLASSAAYATQTETVSSGTVGTLGIYKEVVQTATAANEIACVDVTGWDFVCASVDVEGTINVDLDAATSTAVVSNELQFGVSMFDNATADFGHCFGIYTTAINVTGQDPVTTRYLCYDIDSCTTCTLEVTWYLFSKRQF